MSKVIEPSKLTRKDFMSDQEVRWCPGCGDYSILATVQRVMPELNVPRENLVFVSGIGCSSRFPYYMQTYGFHTIHGRAPAFVTGIKAANPDLTVWMITGDGDGLSIGGNHLMHALRRNLDVNILLFNNRIYGLTKGQYSPTSEVGKVTKSTPLGSVDEPVDPSQFAIGCRASFIARAIDTDAQGLGDVLRRAAAHRGTAFVEIYQNCPVFNDDAFENFANRKQKNETQLHLKHGEPLMFMDGKKGLTMNTKSFSLELATVGENGVTEDDILRHDETNPALAEALIRLPFPAFPVALGVLHAVERPTYDQKVKQQRAAAIDKNGPGDLEALLNQGSWTV